MRTVVLVLFFILAMADGWAEYDDRYIAVHEWVHGAGRITLGGNAAIDEMFHGIPLKNLKILDLGCALGSTEFYLAEQQPLYIVGADPDGNMIARAEAMRKSKPIYIQKRTEFVRMEALTSLAQFADNSFDVVTSKEALMLVPYAEKAHYFSEMYRVLKPGGRLVILDWMHTSPNYSDEVREMFELDGIPINLSTPFEYKQQIAKANFKQLQYQDRTALYTSFHLPLLKNLEKNREDFVDTFTESLYEYALRSWGIQHSAFARRELLVGLVTARK